MFNRITFISAANIVAGYLLFAYDDLYGPKDDILYLWPIPVMLLMAVAVCILLYQVGWFLFRWAAAHGG